MKQLLAHVQNIFDEERFLSTPEELYQPIEYTLHLGGKRIRPFLLLAANQMFGGDINNVRHAAIGIEVFHNFTLLHDDLMDCSPLRRGMPTVYTKWSPNTAILSGDTMFALAWRYMLKQPHPNLHEILNTFNETAIEVCEGQQYDMNFEHMDDVTMEDYLNMIRLKTAVLLAGALKMGALFAQAPRNDVESLYNFGIHMGLAFQLQDDLLDAYGETDTLGKTTRQDIRDNKKTFLYIKALQLANPVQRQQLKELFDSTPDDCTQKIETVLGIYQSLNIKEHTIDIIQSEFEKAQKALQSVQVSNERKKPLEELMAMLLGRDK